MILHRSYEGVSLIEAPFFGCQPDNIRAPTRGKPLVLSFARRIFETKCEKAVP